MHSRNYLFRPIALIGRIPKSYVFIVLLIASLSILFYSTGRKQEPSDCLRDDGDRKWKSLAQETRKLIIKAHRSARSGETKRFLIEALNLMNNFELTSNQHQNHTSPADNSHGGLLETCPEYWGDPREDRVYFENVYKTIACDRIPLEQLVELLIYSESCVQGLDLIDRIRLVYPTLHIHLAVQTTEISTGPCISRPMVSTHLNLEENGATWLKLANSGKTKYILVGRNMVDFTHYTNIDRMLRVMNSLDVDVVGGAVRLEPEGRWYFGCYQAAIRNFTIRIHPGYDLSAQSCAYCDYIASPFLVRRDVFRRAMFSSPWLGVVPFVEFFLRGSNDRLGNPLRTIVCPDVLFYVSGHSGLRGLGVAETPRSSWEGLVKKWVITRVVLPGNVEHYWGCDEIRINCGRFKIAGMILPECCLQELAKCLKGFLSLAESNDVTAFIVTGTLMGAVKIFNGLLPWERDADVCWDAYKYEVVAGPIGRDLRDKYTCELGPPEMKTEHGVDIAACSRTTNNSCIYHPLRSRNWRIELYGEPILLSNRLWGLKNPTSIMLNGMWVLTVHNPAVFLRNQYGDNILAHIQHWMDLGETTGWSRYTNVENQDFPPCPDDAVKHACLSGNYLPQGNIQFQDIHV